MNSQVLPHGERVEELGIVGHVGQFTLGGHRIGHDVVSGDDQPAAVGGMMPAKARKRGRLARAVGADQTQDRAARTSNVSPATAVKSR